jgi:formate hydrogenlyase subunit 5
MTIVAGAARASSVPALWQEVTGAVTAGRRFADLFGTQLPDGLLLSVQLAGPGDVITREALVAASASSYPALTPWLPAAFWYEREIRDMFGVSPTGHPRPEPLLLGSSADPPRPGSGGPSPAAEAEPGILPGHVTGPGMFTIPHGPVRSGVVESIEYLVETPGEDIPHLNMRIFYKHRGVEKRFEGSAVATGVLLAERAEGIASVAHALAYCHAIEQIAGVTPPRRAALIRVVHAELERLACHLDVIVRLADSAGQAVAVARFGWHKEEVLRLVSKLCGSRFGRGVVVPGGVTGPMLLQPGDLDTAAAQLSRRVTADLRLLMGTASFLDWLRRTGPLPPDRAAAHGALGPIGRASGLHDDARWTRPYDAYPELKAEAIHRDSGDAMARLEVRVDEIGQSFSLLRQTAGMLGKAGPETVRALCEPAAGRAVGWAEAPQGEVLYDVQLSDGLIRRCRSRSASFHNLYLMHAVFAGDILTDFPFIEASFGLSVAGAAG